MKIILLSLCRFSKTPTFNHVMRHIYFILLSVFSIIAFGSCNPNPQYIYRMRVTEQVNCAHDAESVEFEYALHNAVDKSTVTVTATTSAEWITSIDTSEIGKVQFTVEQNDGTSRSATITLLATEHEPAKINITQFGTPPAKSNHTLMFLFLGTSLDRYFKTNIEDAKAAIKGGVLGNSNRVLFFRQSSATKAYIGELCYDATTGECAERRVVDNISISASQATAEDLAGYINMMSTEAPADRYGMVMAGHGQAWIQREALKTPNGGISAFGTTFSEWTPAPGSEATRAYGENNTQYDITEIAEAIELSDITLDYILFDACFMSNIETIYDLRNSANYIIASPCEIMGRGFPYERTLPHMFADNGMSTDYIKAAESYYIYYRDEYVGQSRCGSIAVIDCSKIEPLADITAEIVDWKRYYDRKELQTYEGQKEHYFFDFGQWANVVAKDEESAHAFNEQFNKVIIAKYSLESFYSAYGTYGTYPIDLDVYSGMTTSVPTESSYFYNMKETNWYQHLRPDTLNEDNE